MSKKSVLSKEISLKSKKGSYPTKTSMNFIKEDVSENKTVLTVCSVLFAVFLLCFTKLFVLDPLTKMSKLESDYNALQSQIQALQADTADFKEVKARYNDLVGSFLTEDEKNSLNRTDVLNMIDQDIRSSVDVSSIRIHGNQISVYTAETDLSTVSHVISVLQSDERNDYVTVTTTSSNSSNSQAVTADIEITYHTVVESTEEANGYVKS